MKLMENPDVLLTTVHRQALESPIIRQSMAIREGTFRWQDDGENFRVLDWVGMSRKERRELFLTADQIICGSNETRCKYNKSILQCYAIQEPYPTGNPKEKLIVRKNDHKRGLYNGMNVAIDPTFKIDITHNDFFMARVIPEDGTENTIELKVYKGHFDFADKQRLADDSRTRIGLAEIDWAFVLTCHKAQGSEWPHVLILVEQWFINSMPGWLYTAVTRASERVTLLVNAP